ncbi:MAG: ribonuclease D, partial [Porticoccaceae bacterium]|nr:ribonuclease D [Porticoccaceae bacterium]
MYHWVDSDQALKEMLSHLVGCHLLAVDTEFIRTNTFHPKIALVQISDGDQCWLVDVLAFQTFENLKELLEAPH